MNEQLVVNGCSETAMTLRGWLNHADSLAEVVYACQRIELVLSTTRGLWLDADYTYKGREIARDAAKMLWSMVGQPGIRKTQEQSILSLRTRLMVVEMDYHTAEMSRLGRSN